MYTINKNIKTCTVLFSVIAGWLKQRNYMHGQAFSTFFSCDTQRVSDRYQRVHFTMKP